MMYKARSLHAWDLLLPMAAMLVTFFVGIFFGYADVGWLIGMSVAIIGLVARMYRDASDNVRFWSTLGSFLVLHLVVIGTAFHVWHSLPVRALTPLFALDFIAMGLSFPKLTGVAFNEND